MTVQDIKRAFLRALRPPPKLTLSEWADQFAVMSSESSADAGKWHTIPYQRGMMDAITDPTVEQVTVMKSARVGYTKCLNHVIAYHVHQDPCPIMLVQPTIEDAEGYSKEEIAPMLRDTPVLSGIVSDAKAKDGSNTILQKIFAGGTLSLVGANSPRGFRRVSRRVVLFDEVDGYPASAGTEGDQIKLGIKRSEYFWNRKIVAGSTPTIKDSSRIERLFAQSDQRRYFVPCPSCGEFQYLKWPNLKWPDGEPERAYFVCEKNGCTISHDKKRWMVERGEWRATAPGNGRHAGFHIWAAYSYSPNASWGTLASEFLEAKQDAESLKTFINTALGELWEEEYQAKVGAESLKTRVENYPISVAPKGSLVLTAGVDVQDNRFSLSLYAWGRGEESWLIARHEIFGDPSQAEIWKQLDSVLLQKYRTEDGFELPVAVACVDSGGHFTNEVYQYCRERKARRVLAIKGASKRGQPPIGKPTRQDVNYKNQTLKSGVDLYPLGTDTIKDTIYARLKHNEPGPGYIHFYAGIPDDFFEQLTVEKKVTRYSKGFPVREWIKPNGKRNEALDEAVYAYAAMQWLYTRYHRQKIWELLEREMQVRGSAVPAPVAPPEPRDFAEAADPRGAAAPSQEKPPASDASALRNNRPSATMPKRRPGGFVSRY